MTIYYPRLCVFMMWSLCTTCQSLWKNKVWWDSSTSVCSFLWDKPTLPLRPFSSPNDGTAWRRGSTISRRRWRSLWSGSTLGLKILMHLWWRHCSMPRLSVIWNLIWRWAIFIFWLQKSSREGIWSCFIISFSESS